MPLRRVDDICSLVLNSIVSIKYYQFYIPSSLLVELSLPAPSEGTSFCDVLIGYEVDAHEDEMIISRANRKKQVGNASMAMSFYFFVQTTIFSSFYGCGFRFRFFCSKNHRPFSLLLGANLPMH